MYKKYESSCRPAHSIFLSQLTAHNPSMMFCAVHHSSSLLDAQSHLPQLPLNRQPWRAWACLFPRCGTTEEWTQGDRFSPVIGRFHPQKVSFSSCGSCPPLCAAAPQSSAWADPGNAKLRNSSAPSISRPCHFIQLTRD